MSLRAVIFDLGGTLIDWPYWDDDISRRWGLSYDYLASALPSNGYPSRDAYVKAMRAAEVYHWQQVAEKQASNTPMSLLNDGFYRLGWRVSEKELLTALDGYAHAVSSWAGSLPDAAQTLLELRKRDY